MFVCVVNTFLCVRRLLNTCCVGDATRHFSTGIQDHLTTDRAARICRHLQNSENVALDALLSLPDRHYLNNRVPLSKALLFDRLPREI